MGSSRGAILQEHSMPPCVLSFRRSALTALLLASAGSWHTAHAYQRQTRSAADSIAHSGRRLTQNGVLFAGLRIAFECSQTHLTLGCLQSPHAATGVHPKLAHCRHLSCHVVRLNVL